MLTSQNHYLFLMFFFRSTKNKSHKKMKKKHEKTHLFKNTIKTNEISTFPSLRSVPRTTPDDQNHPRAPPGPPPDTLRKLHVFSEPPGGLPRDPPGPPGDPPRDPPRPPRDAQGPPGEPPTLPRDPPSDPQGPPEDAQDPPRESHRAKGPPRDRPLDSARRNARSD